MSDDFDQTMNDEADRLLDDAEHDLSLVYGLYELSGQSLSKDAFQTQLEDLIQSGDFDYATDIEHLASRLKYRRDNSLVLWRGFYRLIGPQDETFNLVITAEDDDGGSDAKTPEIMVFLNGMIVKDYTVADATLTWDNPKDDGSGTKGSLKFTGFFDDDSFKSHHASDYFGAQCVGQIVSASASIDVMGKQGVYSPEAARGAYDKADPLTQWSGKYLIRANDGSKEGVLTVLDDSTDADKRVLFEDAVINGFSNPAGALVWKGKEDKNSSIGRLSFVQTTNDRQFVAGSLRFADGSGMVDVSGLKVQSIAPPGEAVKIKTVALAPATAKEPFSAGLVADGGTEPYTWDARSLTGKWPEDAAQGAPQADPAMPPGLEFIKDGSIIGTPTQPGTFAFRVRVTDSSDPAQSAEATLSLIVAKSTDKPIESQILPWIVPAIAAVLALIGGFLIKRARSGDALATEKAAQEKERAATAALAAQRNDVNNLDNATTLDARKVIYERRRKAQVDAMKESRDRLDAINAVVLERNTTLQEQLDDLQADFLAEGDPAEQAKITDEIAEKYHEIKENADVAEDMKRDLPHVVRDREIADRAAERVAGL